jgi:hypothetical protein
MPQAKAQTALGTLLETIAFIEIPYRYWKQALSPKPKSSCIEGDDLAVLRNNAKHVNEATPQFAVCNEHPESIQSNEAAGTYFYAARLHLR